jgi:Tfp pilus assembly protein PilW
MVIVPLPPGATRRQAEAGFSLVELLVAMVVSILVVGGAALMGTQMQSTYRGQLEAAGAQQEGRFALQWIERYLRAAGNNPYRVQTTACPAAGTPVRAIRFDPNGNFLHDDIRIQTDSNPTDGLFGGLTGACNQANEDVTITFLPSNNSLVVRDNVTALATVRTDTVIEGLEFIYRNPSRVVTTNPENVAFIETRLRVRTKVEDQTLGDQFVQTVSSEIRVRVR